MILFYLHLFPLLFKKMRKFLGIILATILLLGAGLFLIKSRLSPSQSLPPPEKKIFGGIVPHDFSVGFMNIELIRKLILQKPKLIILLGPNHYEKGESQIAVYDQDWQVKGFGVIRNDPEFVNDLLKNYFVKVNNEIFEQEHSIGNNMIHLYTYLPETKVVPIIFKKNCPLENLEALAKYLATKVDDNTVILASVDFSHYLNSSEAQKMDTLTLQEMKKFNYEKILSFDSKNLDSPSSIVTLLMVMEKLKKTKMGILRHINSAEIKKSSSAPTTSYYSIIFY